MKIRDLLVPVNPEFKWDEPPDGQFEYVNPVTLNNRQVSLANAAISVTSRHVQVNKNIGEAKARLQDAENALEDFEQDLLVQFPPPAKDAKTLKLLQAYVRATAHGNEKGPQFQQLQDDVRKVQRELTLLKVDAENCIQMFQAIKLAGEHGQTHLSYVKDEAKRASRYT